jgi:hypothetical protein
MNVTPIIPEVAQDSLFRASTANDLPMVVLVPTDRRKSERYEQALHVAAKLALRSDGILVLGDRACETWTQTPHHRGPSPIASSSVRSFFDHHLHGLRDDQVFVFTSSLPTIESFDAAVEIVCPTMIVTPGKYDRLTLDERVHSGNGVGDMLKRRAPHVCIVEVQDCGSLRFS